MASDTWLATREIRAVFEEVIAALGGAVADVFDDGSRLFARSTLPEIREVGPGDGVQGGVAVRANARVLNVHPYVFRQFCRNGAIMARALHTWRVEQVELRDPDEVVVELREAVRACASEEAFTDATTHVRSTREADADRMLALLPMLARRRGAGSERFMAEIVERLLAEDDRRSAFGVMNAVTSLARDSRDPQQRWDLEELGGAVAASAGGPRSSPIAAAKRLARV